MNLRIGIITQARMGSTRLPGKILKTVNSVCLLEYHLRGLEKAGLPIIVATTEKNSDEIVEFCRKRQTPFFKGSEDDVLSRFYFAAVEAKLDIVVRVTSDCPLVDGSMIKDAIEKSGIMENREIYVSNILNRSFPRGYDFEIFSFEMLKEAFEKANQTYEREHVTPYINTKAVQEKRVFDYLGENDFSSFRLTVDTQEDFDLIEILIKEHHADRLSYKEVCGVLKKHPELKAINADIVQKPIR